MEWPQFITRSHNVCFLKEIFVYCMRQARCLAVIPPLSPHHLAPPEKPTKISSRSSFVYFFVKRDKQETPPWVFSGVFHSSNSDLNCLQIKLRAVRALSHLPKLVSMSHLSWSLNFFVASFSVRRGRNFLWQKFSFLFILWPFLQYSSHYALYYCDTCAIAHWPF